MTLKTLPFVALKHTLTSNIYCIPERKKNCQIRLLLLTTSLFVYLSSGFEFIKAAVLNINSQILKGKCFLANMQHNFDKKNPFKIVRVYTVDI